MSLVVALYARVSSAGQRDRDTIASQLAALRDHCRRQGWKVHAEYVDDGKSASRQLERRDAFARLIADAEAGRFAAVVVMDFSRLTRTGDWAERGAILGKFQHAGVRLVEASTGTTHELGTTHGDLLAFLGSWRASEERKAMVERTGRGAEARARAGGKPRGKTPYGLRYILENPASKAVTWRWEIHPTEAPIVREIFKRVVAGESCMAVGRDLDRRRIPTPRGFTWQHAIWRIVARPAYRGELVVDKRKGITVAVPRLVSDEVWYAAQAAVARSALRGLRRTRHTYLCEGLGICGDCGAPVWISSESSQAGGRRYYVCSQRKRPNPTKTRCTAPMRQTKQVDAEVWEALAGWLQQPLPALLRAIAGRRGAAELEARTWEQDVAGWRKQLAQLEDAEVAILDQHAKGTVSAAAMGRHLKTTAARRAMLERQIEAATRGAGGARSRGREAADLAAVLAAVRARAPLADLEERRRIVQSHVAEVTVGAEVMVRLRFPEAQVASGGSDGTPYSGEDAAPYLLVIPRR